MESLPKIKLKLTKTDKIIEAIGYLILAGFWIMVIVSFSDLPENIPIHYNVSGEVDGYSKKTSIFLLPIIGTFMFIILTLLNANPETFKYDVKITAENAQKQYANATQRMRLMKVIVIFLFLLIDYQTIQIAKGNSEGLGIWFLPLTMGLIFIPIIYFINKSSELE